MRIGGLHKHSLIDYPDRIAAVVFTQGCNFRCPYCHNPSLVYPEQYGPVIDTEEVHGFLQKRHGLLDGVVITGGEPLLQQDLEQFILSVKRMGYKVKLDTNGSMPERLQALLSNGLVDYVAMDYKAPLRAYHRVVRVKVDAELIKRSINYITSSGINYELRTTLHSGLCMSSVLDMIAELRQMRVEFYYLQMFVPFDGCDRSLVPHEFDMEILKKYLLFNFYRSGIRNLEEEELSVHD